VNNEAWFEMDLYWFQGGNETDKAVELFDRYISLFNRSQNARKGLMLCAGFNMESVLCWNGNIDDEIASCNGLVYEKWTYRRLHNLVKSLREEALKRNLTNFHVGLIQIAHLTSLKSNHSNDEGRYHYHAGRTDRTGDWWHYDILGKWFPYHPEVVDQRFPDRIFWGARINLTDEESEKWGGPLPTMAELYARKITDMGKKVGIDAVVLRDATFCPSYFRKGKTRYFDNDKRDEWNNSLIELLRNIKENDENFIIIGYSSGASAMEEWRSHGFDLEKVAGSGFLDLWITQTWASAWQDYWPSAALGYTFQLANVLIHQAMLANTPCKHMFLIETFDAWEPFETVHEFPEKLIWEIWAYSHAVLRFSDESLSRSTGYYMSWMNKAERLLPESSVNFLKIALNSAFDDIALKPVPCGPAAVFDRESCLINFQNPVEYCKGEAMDDWISMLMKYSVPCMSIVRREDMCNIQADGFILAAPVSITAPETLHLLELMKNGKSILIMGQAINWSSTLRNQFGITVSDNPVIGRLPISALVEDSLAEIIGTKGVVINQLQQSLSENSDWETLINCLSGPVLMKHHKLPMVLWETPEWGTPDILALNIKTIQSPQTYFGVAAVLNSFGWGDNTLKWKLNDWTLPGTVHLWKYSDGKMGILMGNLETGVTGCSMFPLRVSMRNDSNSMFERHEAFNYGRVEMSDDGTMIFVVPGHKSALFVSKSE
jgi:hypothetical protein